MSSNQQIVNIILDEKSVVRRAAHVEHERKVAVYDLLEDNHFKPAGGHDGPYVLHLGIEENRLVFDIRTEDDAPLDRFTLPLNTFRRIVKDYFMVCENYFEAIKTAPPSRRRRRHASRLWTWAAGDCTTKAPTSCATAWRTKSRSICQRPGVCSP